MNVLKFILWSYYKTLISEMDKDSRRKKKYRPICFMNKDVRIPNEIPAFTKNVWQAKYLNIRNIPFTVKKKKIRIPAIITYLTCCTAGSSQYNKKNRKKHHKKEEAKLSLFIVYMIWSKIKAKRIYRLWELKKQNEVNIQKIL